MMKQLSLLLLAFWFTTQCFDVALPRITSLVDDSTSIQAHVDDMLGGVIHTWTVHNFLRKIGGTAVFHDFAARNRRRALSVAARIKSESEMFKEVAMISAVGLSIVGYILKDISVDEVSNLQIIPIVGFPILFAGMTSFFSHQAYHLSRLERALSRS